MVCRHHALKGFVHCLFLFPRFLQLLLLLAKHLLCFLHVLLNGFCLGLALLKSVVQCIIALSSRKKGQPRNNQRSAWWKEGGAPLPWQGHGAAATPDTAPTIEWRLASGPHAALTALGSAH